MKKIILFHCLLVGSGLLFGILAYVYLPQEQTAQLQQYLLAQMKDLAVATTISDAAARIFRANVMDLVRVYLAGICLLGLPLLVLFLFLKGFTLGFVTCFLIAHSPLLILTRLLYYPLLIMAAVYSCRFSMRLLQNRVDSPARQLVQYTVTFAFLLLLVLLFSYVDGFSCYHYLQRYTS